MRGLVTAVVVIMVSACAPKGPSPQTLADLARADTLLRDGCYECLEDALTIYERHKHAQGAFDAARPRKTAMIDNFALGLSHGLLLLAAWRLLSRPDLNDDDVPAPKAPERISRWGAKPPERTSEGA